MTYKFRNTESSLGHEDRRGLTGSNISMADTPVGLGLRNGQSPLVTYTGEQLRRGEATRDARVAGYSVRTAAEDGRVQFVTRTMAAAVARAAAPKPAAPAARAEAPAPTPAPASASPRTEIIRPLAEDQEHSRVALVGLRNRVTEILRDHGVHTVAQTEQQQNGVIILNGATVQHAASRSGAVKGLVKSDALVDRVAQDQPDTHNRRVSSEGAQPQFLGARAGRRPNAVALRILGADLNNEASAATRTVGTVAQTGLRFPGALISIAEVTSEGGIPGAAETPIRHAITESGVPGMKMSFDPSPMFNQPEAGAVQSPMPSAAQ